MVGLILAVDGYDAAKGPFIIYASRAINHRLLSMCAHQMRPYRIPNYLNTIILKIRKSMRELRLRGIFEPSNSIISEQSGLSLYQVDKALPLMGWLRVPSNGFLSSEEAEPINVGELFAPLGPDEQNLLNQRYGLDGRPPLTLRDIAGAEGVTRECIRKRQQRALDKVRQGAEA